MKDKKIAILSTDPILSRFFELEAIAFGFQANCFEDPVEIRDGYDLIIVDCETHLEMPEVFSCIIGLVSDGSKRRMRFPSLKNHENCYDLSWPPSITEIRDLFSVVCNTEDRHQNNEGDNSQDDSIIYYSDNDPCAVWYKNKKITLTESESKLLFALCGAKKEIVSREEINSLFEAKNGNIGDVYIHHLRKKLEEPFAIKIIRTVRSRGYCIDATLKKM